MPTNIWEKLDGEFEKLWGEYPKNKIDNAKGLDFLIKSFIHKNTIPIEVLKEAMPKELEGCACNTQICAPNGCKLVIGFNQALAQLKENLIK